jgi:hypothetical protein
MLINLSLFFEWKLTFTFVDGVATKSLERERDRERERVKGFEV